MGAKLTLEGTSSGAVKAVDDLNKAITAVEKGLVQSTKSSAQLEKAALQITKTNQTPMEKYTRQMVDLAAAVKSGKLPLEEAEKAAARYGIQLENVGKKSHDAIGSVTLGNAAKLLAGFASLQGMIRLITDGLSEMEAKGQKAADSTMANLGSLGELQIASASQEDFQKNLAFSRGLISRGVVNEKESAKALQITTAFTKAGLSDSERESLAKLADDNLLTPEQMAPFGVGVRAIQEIFGSKAGSFDQIANQLIEGSRFSKMDPAELATMVQKYGRTALAAGKSFEEALTAGTVISRTSATAKGAASRAEKYFDNLGDPKTQGQKGAGVLSDAELKMFDEELAKIHKAEAPQSYMSSDSRMNAADLREAAEGSLAQAESAAFENKESLFDTYIARASENALKEGGGLSEYAVWSALKLADIFQLEDLAFRATDLSRLPDADRAAIEQYLNPEGNYRQNTEEQRASLRAVGPFPVDMAGGGADMDKVAELLDRQHEVQERTHETLKKIEENQRTSTPQPSGRQE